MPHLVYIGQAPAEGTGSPVIILRHLRRLAASGWKISIIAERGQDDAACAAEGWPVHTLPLRRPWWPPFRPDQPFLRALRTWLLGAECGRVLDQRPDAILGYLAAHADFYPEIAARYARLSGIPFSLLIHDDAACFGKTPAETRELKRRHAWILAQAHRNLFVSPELAGAYDLPPAEADVLAPIPEGRTQTPAWQPGFATQPRLYYAGFVWPAQYPLMAKIAVALDQVGARLVLMTRETPELKAFLATAPVDYVPPFPLNTQAVDHLATHAAGLVVSYAETIEEMSWIATSFPSKLVEFCHLGLPMAIVSPRGTAVGNWAASRGVKSYFLPQEMERLAAWAAALREEVSWEQAAREWREIARGEFSAGQIQSEFESGLLR